MKSRRDVVVVAFDRISPFHLAVPCIVLEAEHAGVLADRYRLRVCAAEPGRLRTTRGSTSAFGSGSAPSIAPTS